ncbi:MAG: BamA/TamA family outer membrane protein [bacterium]|nr:BamA/TamA family outer membrane protein [bacterium]
MIKKLIILLLIMTAAVVFSPAVNTEQETDEKTGVEALKKKCKNRIIAAPIVFYTPETKFAFGAAGSYIFRLAGCKKETRPSSISPIVIYTTKKQFQAGLNSDLYFKNNNYRLETQFRLQKFPNKFFGVGNQTLEDDEELYTSKNIYLFLSFEKRIVKGFNIGIQYHFDDWKITETTEDGQLMNGTIPGSTEGKISGLGFLLKRDTRDNIFSPLKGDFFEFYARFYKEFLGSDYDYTELNLNLRKYINIVSNHVFAVQAMVKSQTGTVPFLQLARMGGQFNMRGYFDGRFRDKNLLLFQAEYRMPILRRFGVVGFAGVGNVAGKFSELKMGEFKTSYGFGFRYLFDKKEKIWLRVDFGFGKDSSGFYFSIFEAF